MKKYDDLVMAEWKRYRDRTLEGCRIAAGLPIVPTGLLPWPEREIAFRGYRLKCDLLGHFPIVEKDEIKKILKGSSDDLISRVATALKPVDIEKMWVDGLPFILFSWSKSQRKQLNQLIKQHGTHLKWLQKQIDHKELPMPSIVKKELQQSASALYEGIELAKAFVRLFDSFNTRWKPSGEDYVQITRNPYWNDIIRSVETLINEAMSDRNNYYLSDKSPYRLLADLLHFAYPWAWKNDAATLKLLRERA